MSELPPFELRPVCCKCTNDRWRCEWFDGQRRAMQQFAAPQYECLRLTCDRCGYTFDMATKDAADAG